MNKKRAILLATLSTIFWGANFNVSKILLGYLSPLNLATLRFLCSFILIFPVILFIENRNNIKQMIQQDFGVHVALSIIGVVGYNTLIFEGLKYTTPINAALIMATNPLLTMLLARLFLKEIMSINQKIGAFISFISVGLIITHGSLTELLNLQLSVGDIIVMLANICWALYGVLARCYLKQSSPLITTASTMCIGSVILMLLAGYNLNANMLRAFIHQLPDMYGALIYMIIFGTVLAYLFWNYSINQLGAGKTSIFFNLIPVVTTIIAIILGQTITSVQIIGGIGVIFGVLLSTSAIKSSLDFLKLNDPRTLLMKLLK